VLKLQPAFLSIAILAAFIGSAHATESFVDDMTTDFASGNYTTASLTQDGFLVPPPERVLLSEIDEDIAWDVVEVKGVRYIATGHRGRLYRQEDRKPATVVAQFKEPALYAVAPLKKGGLAVAASPGGQVHQLNDDGTTSTLASTGAAAVWDLVPHKKGLLAATGSPAGVVLIDDRGTTSSLVSLKKNANVLSIATLPDSEDFVIATQGPGLVLRVGPNGTARVLLDPEQEEVRRVASMGDGSVVAAVNAIRSPGERMLSAQPAGGEGGNRKPGPESFIARIYADGFAEEWWTSPESPIHDVLVRADGSLLVAAGSEGHLFHVAADRQATRIGIASQRHLVRLVPSGEGSVLIATAGKAALVQLHPEKPAKGEFESRQFDAKGSARWSSLRGVAAPNGGRISVAYRSGNTLEPSDHWSTWSEPVPFDGSDVKLSDVVGRFLQYRVELFPAVEHGAGLPSVDLMRVFYGRPNVAPRLTAVTIEEPRAKDPAAAAANRGKVDIAWQVNDPNGDTLSAEILLHSSREGAKPTLLQKDFSGDRFTLDTTTIPDGRYRAEVISSDAPSQPVGEERTARAVGPLFLVDNNAPIITLQKVERTSAGVVIEFTALDSASVVTAAQWRAGIDPARPVAATDGFLDSGAEAFTVTLRGEQFAPGSLVTLSVQDEGENASHLDVLLP
jgi:hypothetical protein